MRVHRLAAALAVAFFGVLGMPALGADKMGVTGMPPEVAQPPPIVAVDTSDRHSGAYVGLTAGLNATSLQTPGITSAIADTGLFGGAYVGWGAVIGGTYVGAEVDGMLRDVTPRIGDGSTTVTISNNWMASGRLRVGLPIGPALLYGTGGVAVQESVLKVSAEDLSARDKQYLLGLVLGGGIEAKLTNTVHVRVEGLHYEWRDKAFLTGGTTSEKLGQSDTVIRVGVGFKLN